MGDKQDQGRSRDVFGRLKRKFWPVKYNQSHSKNETMVNEKADANKSLLITVSCKDKPRESEDLLAEIAKAARRGDSVVTVKLLLEGNSLRTA